MAMVVFIMLAFAAALAFEGLKYARSQRELEQVAEWGQRIGMPKNAMAFRYEGGHPNLPHACDLYAWRDTECLRLAPRDGINIVRLGRSDIVEISVAQSIQHVNQGGRSVGGAVVGTLLFGGIGGIVGGQKATKVVRHDESRAIVSFSYDGMKMQMVFEGGAATAGKLATLLRSDKS